MQATIKRQVSFSGIGLHSGEPVAMRLFPEEADQGICFARTDITGRDNRISAAYDKVASTDLCTVIENSDGVRVSTVEHIMAALAGTGIFNVRVEVDGPEVPIMDGSAEQFVQEILQAGVKPVDAPIRAIRILENVSIAMDDVTVALSPCRGSEIDFRIEYKSEAIGTQAKSLDMANGTFVRELSLSRTFVELADIPKVQARGLGRGGSYATTMIIDGPDVLNPDGFRYRDECVRHKMLDAFGDLALAGAPILGKFTGVKAGHGATNKLLRKLFSTPGAWDVVDCDEAMNDLIPGYHIMVEDQRRDQESGMGSRPVFH